MEGLGNLHHTDTEIGRVNNQYSLVRTIGIFCAIIVYHMKIQCLCRHLCVKLTWFPIHAWTVIVKDPVGDIGRLLYLGQQNTSTNSMNTTGREVKDITRFHLVVSKDFGYGSIFDALLVLVGCDLLLEACIEVGTIISLDDIPHLGFSHLTMLSQSHFIVWMYLNAQVLFSIYELYQQRQLAIVLLIYLLAKDGVRVFSHDRDQVAPCPWAIADDAGTCWDSTDLPALAYRLAGRFQTFVGSELVTTPHHSV